MLRTELIAPPAVLLRRHRLERGARLAFSDASRSVTYAELDARTRALAAGLADLGLAPGDRVAIHLPNGVDWVETCLAALRAGAVVVPISADATSAEVHYRLVDADCRIAVTSDICAAALEDARSRAPALETVVRAGVGAGGIRLTDLTGHAGAARDPADIMAPAFIVYTSGTTGRAKGVLLSLHGMLWVAAACWAPFAGLGADDAVLSPLPLFHSYALNLSVLAIVATGARCHILERFSPRGVLEHLASGDHSVLPGVPTMFHYLLQTADPGARLPGLRACVSAGAIMPAALNRDFEDRFGVPLLDGYGITETSTMVTMNAREGTRRPGSCGLPLPGLAVRLLDPLTGEDAAPGAVGELIVRGPNVMAGYHNKPDETAAALRKGWYHTGDLARSDADGYLTITGRLKELIIRGGQNIAPAEVEEVVNDFPAVFDCAVVGLPHESLGEVPALFVVPREGHRLDLQALVEHCRARLSAYKLPQVTHLVAAIPRTGSGKIMRFKLREAVMDLPPGA